jgi:branched-chain amino acid transport system substrate-binding protein
VCKHQLRGYVTSRNLSLTINQDECPEGTFDEGETHMKKTRLVRAAALAVSLAFVAAACGDDSDSGSTEDTTAAAEETTTGDTTAPAEGGEAAGGATCAEGTSIAFFGALSGDAGNLGQNIKKGAELAVAQFNAANAGCQVTLKEFDSQGSPDQAPALATEAIADAAILGIVGPAFSGESKAVNPLFDEAGLSIITPSATNEALNDNGWKIFHRALAGDDKQGPGIVAYIQNKLAAETVGVIDDASEYGKGIADIVREGLGDKVVASDSIDPAAADFSAAVSKMKDAAPAAIFYGGYYAEAGKLAKQLRDAGVESTLVFGDGVKDIGYIEAAGPAAEGSIITCTCADGGSNADFAAAYGEQFPGETPQTYAAEAYDAANAFLAAITSGAADRAAVLEFLKSYDAAGVTKQIKWDETGEVAGNAVYSYKVEGGAIVVEGLIE